MLSKQSAEMLNKALVDAMAETDAAQADVDACQAQLDEFKRTLKAWKTRVAELKADLQ